MKLLQKLKAASQCRREGHSWSFAGTAFDCDGGYGGGTDLYRYRCARCGKQQAVPWPMRYDKHEGPMAGKDDETCLT